MGFIIADRVKETTSTTGTGTLTLAGAATGFKAFQNVAVAGDNFHYTISSSGGAEWEIGIGTLVTTTTMSRDTVLASSNAGALVTLSAGTKDVFLTHPASQLQTTGQDYALSVGYQNPLAIY